MTSLYSCALTFFVKKSLTGTGSFGTTGTSSTSSISRSTTGILFVKPIGKACTGYTYQNNYNNFHNTRPSAC